MSLFLQWNTGVIPTSGVHDSLKYLDMAETLTQGKWLGDYNHMALIRSPVYSGLLALNCVMGWPLQRTQAIAYLLGIILLAFALKKMNVPGWRIAVVSVLCAFHPVAWFPSRFVAAEALYTPAVTIALAGAIGVMGSVRDARYSFFFWLPVLSISIALAWRMRDEGLWLMPASVVYAGYILWELKPGSMRQEKAVSCATARKQRITECKKWGLVTACIALPCVSIFALTTWIQQQNLRHYGVAVVSELAEPGFKAAFSWLTRLDGGSHHPYVPITRQAMRDANRVSPHFQMLYPFLSRQFDGAGWSQFGCEWMGVCDELAGGWSVWAIRDAANAIGAYASADQAAGFYADLAREIKTGCRTGALVCTSNPTGNMLAAPLKWIDIPRLIASAAKVLWMTLWLEKLPEAYQMIASQAPSIELIERYRPVVVALDGRQRMLPVNFEEFLFWMFRLIQTICCVWILAVVVKNCMVWIRGEFPVKLNGDRRNCWLISLLMVLIISRLAIVGYIDAMSFWAQIRYMLVIYPALITLICVKRLSLLFPRQQDWKESPSVSNGLGEYSWYREKAISANMASADSDYRFLPRNSNPVVGESIDVWFAAASGSVEGMYEIQQEIDGWV